jgi:hypothetical protein
VDGAAGLAMRYEQSADRGESSMISPGLRRVRALARFGMENCPRQRHEVETVVIIGSEQILWSLRRAALPC